jgi:hypothetical protein
MEKLTLGRVGIALSVLSWAGLVTSVVIRSVGGWPDTATLVSWLSTLVGAVMATFISTLALFLDRNKKPAVIGLMLSANQLAVFLLLRDILDILFNVFTHS